MPVGALLLLKEQHKQSYKYYHHIKNCTHSSLISCPERGATVVKRMKANKQGNLKNIT